MKRQKLRKIRGAFFHKIPPAGIVFILTVFPEGRDFFMKGMPEERTILAGEYIIENGATVRSAAREFGVSKSTIHKDVTERLKKLSPELYIRVKAVLEKNKQERHIRGGKATKEKYAKIRQ